MATKSKFPNDLRTFGWSLIMSAEMTRRTLKARRPHTSNCRTYGADTPLALKYPAFKQQPRVSAAAHLFIQFGRWLFAAVK